MHEPENDGAVEEAALLARIGRGDRAALRELYARQAGPLFSLALRMVGDVGEVEELLQDVFVKIWQHAATYDPQLSRPFTWTFTLMRRACIDHLRRRRRAPDRMPLPDAAASDDVVRRAAEAADDSARVRDALADFPADQRAALELALFSPLTHGEIARRLEQPEGTVKSWIRRGLLDLRAALTDSPP